MRPVKDLHGPEVGPVSGVAPDARGDRRVHHQLPVLVRPNVLGDEGDDHVLGPQAVEEDGVHLPAVALHGGGAQRYVVQRRGVELGRELLKAVVGAVDGREVRHPAALVLVGGQ